jgi:hypothetical protein
MSDPVKLLPSEAQPAGHGGTPDLPQPKTPMEWAQQRGQDPPKRRRSRRKGEATDTPAS